MFAAFQIFPQTWEKNYYVKKLLTFERIDFWNMKIKKSLNSEIINDGHIMIFY